MQSFGTEVAAGNVSLLNVARPSSRAPICLSPARIRPSRDPWGYIGILVVTTAPVATPSGTTAGTAYPGVSYNAEVPLLFSEIDPVQNNAVSAAVNTAGFSETTVWSGQPGGCGNPARRLPDLLSAGGELHAAVLPDQRRRVQQDQRLRLSLFPTAPATIAPAAGHRDRYWCAW